MTSITHARLRELLDYDPDTGIFTWRVDRIAGRFARPGMRAGSIHSDGHRQICIERKLYAAGSLAVFWMTGKWPKQIVDHINAAPADDRWINLRIATFAGRYKASIRVNDRFIWLGRHDTAQEAHAAYAAAARKYFGVFARVG